MSILEDSYTSIPDFPKFQDLSTREVYSPNVTVTKTSINDLLERTPLIRDNLNTPACNEYIEMYHPLHRQYVDESVRGDEDTFDRYYYLSHNFLTEKITLRNTNVNFEGSDIFVNNLELLDYMNNYL